MDWKEYQKNAFKNVSLFNRTFKPWNKFQDIKLSDISPCSTCEVHKELITRQYEVQMSGGLQEKITEPCENCLDARLWQMECVQKLGWYEDNDERLKQYD